MNPSKTEELEVNVSNLLSRVDRLVDIMDYQSDMIKNLAMLLKRNCQDVSRSESARLKAMEYLKKNGLMGSPLRTQNDPKKELSNEKIPNNRRS